MTLRHNGTRLLGGSLQTLLVAGLMAAASLPTQAQNTAGDGAGTTRLEGVVVTGSRIRKSEDDGDSPVLTVTAQEIEASGLASVGDILQRLSVTGSSLNTKFNSAGNFGFPADGGGVGSGSTTVSLRNLGANRTLVLVDGLRFVNESSASGVSGAVDLNTIPLSAIERIEVLTDGASSLYGSDAIGGVVNIITKKSLGKDTGLVHFYYGDNETGDGRTYQGNVSFGIKEKTYSGFLDFSHYEQRSVSSAETEQSSFPVPGGGLAFGSSAIPGGRYVFSPPDGVNNYGGLCPAGNCNVVPNSPDAAFPDGYHRFTSADRFNFAPYNFLLTPSRRNAVFGQGSLALNDYVKFYVRGVYQNRVSVNQAAPEPIFLGPGAGTGGLADTIGVDASNPYNPFGYTLDPNSNFAFLGRRPLEGGPRVYRQDVDTAYFAGGFIGHFELFDRGFSWDVNQAISSNNATQTVNGTYNIRNIGNALGPVANCVAPCVPLDIFGAGTITPDQLAYIQFQEHDRSKQGLYLVTANLSGTVINLPAGPLDFATGFEHRRLTGSYSPDEVVIAGDSNGVPSLPTSGRYTINELYAEASVPLLSKQPFAKRLDLSLATRYSNYSTFGDTVKSKAGLNWQPVTDVKLRGTFAEGFRAPSVGESFGSPARFDATITDPCTDATGQTRANCAALGVANPAFEQANTQISVRTGGNRDLKPETARSYTAGAVYSPSWADHKAWSDHLDFDLTYYKHKVKNAIQAPDAQTQLDRCVASGDSTSVFCQGITRGTTGDINGFSNTLRNLGTIDTAGLDLAINWTTPRWAYGRVALGWQTTYVEKYSSVSNDTGLSEPRGVGVEVSDSGIPRFKSTFRTTYSLQPFSITYAVRYISDLKEQCGDAAGLDTCNGGKGTVNKLDDTFYSDIQASVDLPSFMSARTTLTAGVNNAFDAGPPVCVSCSLNGYDASNYDIAGRFAYVEAKVRF